MAQAFLWDGGAPTSQPLLVFFLFTVCSKPHFLHQEAATEKRHCCDCRGKGPPDVFSLLSVVLAPRSLGEMASSLVPVICRRHLALHSFYLARLCPVLIVPSHCCLVSSPGKPPLMSRGELETGPLVKFKHLCLHFPPGCPRNARGKPGTQGQERWPHIH